MKKKIFMFLCLALFFCGCGNAEFLGRENEVSPKNISASYGVENELLDEARETLEEANSIDGFLYASVNYEKYNSYASENGLGGTLVYIEGKVLNQQDVSTEDMPILNLIVEQENGNRWSVAVCYEKDLGDIENKEIRAFGTYNGFSDKFNVPGIVVLDDEAKSKIQVKNESGVYETIWSFQDYLLEYLKEQESVQEENEQQNDEKYVPTIGETYLTF